VRGLNLWHTGSYRNDFQFGWDCTQLFNLAFNDREWWLGLLKLPDIVCDSISSAKWCKKLPIFIKGIALWKPAMFAIKQMQSPSSDRKKLLMAVDVKLNSNEATFHCVFATMFNAVQCFIIKKENRS
jgi:hypothetical protein